MSELDSIDPAMLATRRDEFERANAAFDLFTLSERLAALERFAAVRYPSIIDRFTEAVHCVIRHLPAAGTGDQP